MRDVSTERIFRGDGGHRWGPGDRIDIAVQVDPTTIINDTMTITYYDKEQSMLYTCGHCMPANAKVTSSPCSIIYTSGYGGIDEDREFASIKAHRPEDFTDRSIRICKRSVSEDESVYLLNNGRRIQGKYVGMLSNHNNDRIGDWYVKNVPAVKRPCLIVRGTLGCDSNGAGCSLGTQHGYSGSPWLTSEGELFGYHVARVEMQHEDGRKQEVSVVVPYTQALHQSL